MLNIIVCKKIIQIMLLQQKYLLHVHNVVNLKDKY